MPTTFSREDMIMNMLVEETKKAGHQLSDEEIRNNEALANPAEYAYYKGTSENAARAAWNKIHHEEKGIVLKPLAVALIKKKQENGS